MNHKPFYPLKQEIAPLLEGRMTAIVRPLKHQPHEHHWSMLPESVNYKQRMSVLNCVGGPVVQFSDSYDFVNRLGIRQQNWEDNVSERSPFGGGGSVLMCKETWQWDDNMDDVTEKIFFHKQNWANYPMNSGQHWLSPVTMPKSACRLWLEVLEVKVCKLMDLTNEEMYETGVRIDDSYRLGISTGCEGSVEGFNLGEGIRRVFYEIFDEKFGKRKVTNPWIWYCTIKKHDKQP